MRRPFILLLLAALAGCLKSVPIEGSRCPCPAGEGYVCCNATQTCVPLGVACGAPPDAATGKEPGPNPMPGDGGAAAEGGGGGGPDGGTALPPESDQPGYAPFGRLTPMEMRNTLRDLLGIPAYDLGLFGPDFDPGIGFFRGIAPPPRADDTYRFMQLAQKAAADAVKNLPGLLPCSPLPTAASEQEACAKEFITSFGLRAYRRPVEVAEQVALLALYRTVRMAEGGADFPTGIRVVIEAMLQSPFFLYRWEVTPLPVREGGLVRFTNYEMASRLSYGLWATLPDAELFAAAAARKLETPDQLEAQARRLLADPRAREVVADFYLQSLSAIDLEQHVKEMPFNFTPALARSMIKETGDFVTALLVGPGARGRLEDLLTSTSTFVDGPLAKIYGVTGPNQGTAPVIVDANQRAGILTQAAFLAANANADAPNLSLRGLRVYEKFLCQTLGPASVDDVPIPSPPDPTLTTRERMERYVAHKCTEGCHDIYPLGWAFEHYDTVGAYRTMEPGIAKPIDASGAIMLPSGKLEWKNGVELARKLSQLEETRACVPRQWLRYLLRRKEGPGDAQSLLLARQAFARSSYDIREAIVALTRTRAFTHRTPSVGEVLP